MEGAAVSLSALFTVLASAEGAGEESHTNPYLFGAVTLVIFLAVLFAVTRLNLDR